MQPAVNSTQIANNSDVKINWNLEQVALQQEYFSLIFKLCSLK